MDINIIENNDLNLNLNMNMNLNMNLNLMHRRSLMPRNESEFKSNCCQTINFSQQFALKLYISYPKSNLDLKFKYEIESDVGTEFARSGSAARRQTAAEASATATAAAEAFK